MQASKNITATSAIFGIYRLLIIFFVIFTLYYAQTIVIPLTISALLTFLLSPLVTRLEKWVGRVFSILLVVVVSFSIIGLSGYVFSRQLVEFGSNFKNYNENIQTKLQAFKFPEWEFFNKIENSFGSLKQEIFGESRPDPLSQEQPSENNPSTQVKLIDLSSSLFTLVESFFGSVFSILGNSALVLLLVIFMLLNREDILGRIIKVIGERRISATSSAMNDASERVSDYLFRQLVVNIGFGLCVALGLYLIGIPNALLWGALGTILRFIPYLGPWIAAAIPIALSFIITDTWFIPALTFSFFIILEIITAYFVEPYYYGAGTGVSSFALILAAIFWTWLWGPIGLLLSTPLTVCLVVIGQYVTNFKFLRVLLSHEQALTPVEECYYRLLSFDSNESMDLVEAYLKKNSLLSFYDTVLVPIITQTQMDAHLSLIDSEKKETVYQSIKEIIEFLSLSEQKEETAEVETKLRVFCLPARTIRDEFGVSILTQLLTLESFDVHATSRTSVDTVFELIEKTKPEIICMAVIAPFVLSQTRYLCRKLRQRFPNTPIVIGLWGFTNVPSETTESLISVGATKIVGSLTQLCSTLQEMRASKLSPNIKN